MAERIKYYFDEHVDQAIADGLLRRGIDVLTTQAAGRRGLSDDEQLAFALQEGRVMVTMDSDFLVLAAQGAQHAGIAYVQQQSRSVGDLVRILMLMHESLTPDDMKNHVEYL